MSDLFNPQAADAAVAGVISPQVGELPSLLQTWSGPRPLRVCSGGTSSRCAVDGGWSLDLRPGFRELTLSPDRTTVRVGAGRTMGTLLEVLAAEGLTITAGLSGHPGMGYLLTGGMGPLSRRRGLAIDQLREIRGVWGNGRSFVLQPSDRPEWRALLGAAPFLAIVTDVTLACLPLTPLWVARRSGSPEQLVDWIAEAESWPDVQSLQWCWRGAEVHGLLVSLEPFEGGVPIDGQHCLPSLASFPEDGQRRHGEVVGLLGPAASAAWGRLMPDLISLMRRCPDGFCNLSAQQLGAATARVPVEASAFRHRDAVWKPWITAVWAAGDAEARERSLAWLEEVWALLRTVCPGVHLAQLHDHLPFHQRELELAFGPWLSELRRLKASLDPDGNLPQL